jgi:nucleoside-triphosphatase
MKPAPHVLLLTGLPGVGKTTVIRALAARLPGIALAGFYTEEIRVAGERQGFRAVTFDGHRATMAHVAGKDGPRVGKYRVQVSVLDALADSALRPHTTGVFLVDEIGKMECLSARFVSAMRGLLDSTSPIVATIGIRGAGFLAEVRRRADADLWQVTRRNRDEMPERALAWLEDHGMRS